MHHRREKEELGLTTSLKAEATVVAHPLFNGAGVGTRIRIKSRYELVLEHFDVILQIVE